MKKRYILFGFSVAFVLGFVSCASTPTDEGGSATTQPPVVEEPVQPTQPSVVEEPTQPTELSVVEEPVQPTQPTVDNQPLIDAAYAARQAALDAGADKAAPAQFNDTDAQGAAILERARNGEDVGAELRDLAARYNALEQYAKALAAKDSVDELDFARYDQQNYNRGVASLNNFASLIGDGGASSAQMLTEATDAYTRFNTVLTNGYRARARELRTEAFTAKRNADGVYAAVAEKNTYDTGIEAFRNGDTSYAMQNPESAIAYYTQSRDTFQKLYDDISARRADAQRAIDAARARVADSANYARQADRDAPLQGDDIQGIEDENAVLLEATTYDDPTAAAADLPETLVDAAN